MLNYDLALMLCVLAGAIASGSAVFGQGSGSIFLDEVMCTGFESNLTSCPANPVGAHDCVHGEDAGVQCTCEEISACTLFWLHMRSFAEYYSSSCICLCSWR